MCEFQTVLYSVSELTEPFGIGFMVGAGAVLTVLPVRMLIGLLWRRF